MASGALQPTVKKQRFCHRLSLHVPKCLLSQAANYRFGSIRVGQLHAIRWSAACDFLRTVGIRKMAGFGAFFSNPYNERQ